MKITETWLHEWFIFFNKKYFSSILPYPTFRITMARTYLGQYSVTYKSIFDKTTIKVEKTITISNFYDLEEKVFQSVLLHEMIHYYINYKKIKDTSKHGKVFREMMKSLNKEGWDIKVSHKINCVNREKHVSAKKYMFLAIVLQTGEYMLSVVNPKYVVSLLKEIKTINEIKSYKWYLTNSSYFRNYAQVRTPRGVIVRKSIFEEQCEIATPIDEKLFMGQ